MRKDPTEFRKRFAAWKDGKKPYDGGRIAEVVITPDLEYNLFLNTLPDNQRLTPEENYTTHRYWELNDKPKNFSLAIQKGMYTMEPDGWHANTVLENKKTGEIEFMKPWNHSSIGHEYNWYRSSDPEAVEFRKQYKHVPSAPNAKYVPRFKDGKLPGYYAGLIPWGDTKEQKAVREWGEDWENRAIAGRSKVLLKWSARGKKPQPESSEEYTKRRVAEETKMTPVTRAIGKVMDLPANIQATPGAATAYPAFGQYMPRVQSTIGTEIGNLLDVAFAPQMPGDIVKVLNFVRNIPKRYVAPLIIAREMKKGLGEVPSLYSDDRLLENLTYRGDRIVPKDTWKKWGVNPGIAEKNRKQYVDLFGEDSAKAAEAGYTENIQAPYRMIHGDNNVTGINKTGSAHINAEGLLIPGKSGTDTADKIWWEVGLPYGRYAEQPATFRRYIDMAGEDVASQGSTWAGTDKIRTTGSIPVETLENANVFEKDPLLGTWNRVKYVNPRIQSQKSSSNISWADAQKPLSATEIFPNEVGEGWLKHTADRLGININHYYNNLITPEELAQSAKNYGFEHFVPKNAYTEPAYIPSGFPYGLDKSKILMPYDAIRKMPAMAKYANLPDAEFRKIADNLIGSHEFIHWWNQQLRKNINAGKMKAPVGFLDYELTWVGPNIPSGIDKDLLGNILGYITEANGTESNARTGLLFNAFGLKKGQFRSLHINLAKKFYRKVFPDNLMLRFLDAIKDKDRFIEWANRNAGTLFGLTAPALTIPNITYTQNELRNK